MNLEFLIGIIFTSLTELALICADSPQRANRILYTRYCSNHGQVQGAERDID